MHILVSSEKKHPQEKDKWLKHIPPDAINKTYSCIFDYQHGHDARTNPPRTNACWEQYDSVLGPGQNKSAQQTANNSSCSVFDVT